MTSKELMEETVKQGLLDLFSDGQWRGFGARSPAIEEDAEELVRPFGGTRMDAVRIAREFRRQHAALIEAAAVKMAAVRDAALIEAVASAAPALSASLGGRRKDGGDDPQDNHVGWGLGDD